MLPYDVEQRSALVVRLFRATVLEASGEEMSEEACAGMIENEDADTAARREAYEELGVDLPTGRLNRTPVALPRTLSLR